MAMCVSLKCMLVKKGVREVNLGERVVKDLTKVLRGNYYRIFCDNYFSGIKLFDDLYKDSIYACGTLRLNRVGYPIDLKPLAKKGFTTRGEYKQRQDGNLLLSLWQDNKTVSVISTNCQPGEGVVKRRQKDGSKKSFPCPINIIDYNQYMGGVDHNDQIRQYYSVRLKSHKFYRYVFWFLFDATITNTYILSHYIPTTSKTNLKYIEFRTELARQLIGGYNSRKRSGRPSLVPVTRHMSPQHYPVRAKRRSKCNYCYNTTQQLKYTFWRCDTCNKYLCHTGDLQSDCFLTYHKKAKIY